MTDLGPTAAATAVLALLAGVVTWLIGLDPLRSALLAAGVLTVGAGRAVVATTPAARARDRWLRRTAGRADGTRREVQGLSWSLTGDRRTVSAMGARRVRALAAHRLSWHGVDLHDPAHAAATEHLLGTRAHRVLVGDPARPMREADLDRAVDALERVPDPRQPRRHPPASTPPHDPEPRR